MFAITVFILFKISPPDDVGDEREALPSLIERLNKNIAEPAGLTLRVIGWEDAPPVFNKDGTQAHIDSVLKIEDSHIFIGILWNRT